MIELTKFSRQTAETILLNEDQIQYIEFIPESKITMMNGDYILAQENREEIVSRIVDFRKKAMPFFLGPDEQEKLV